MRAHQSTENERAVAASRGAIEMVSGVKTGAPMNRLLILSSHRRIAIGATPFNMLYGRIGLRVTGGRRLVRMNGGRGDMEP